MLGARINLVNSPLLTASLRNWLNPSMTSRKMRGERGHPWRKPRYALKKGEATPFMSTTKEAIEMHPITQLTKLISNPR